MRNIIALLFLSIIFILFTAVVSAQQVPGVLMDQVQQIKLQRLNDKPEIQKINAAIYEALTSLTLGRVFSDNVNQQITSEKDLTPLLTIDEAGRFQVTLRVTEITSSLISTLQKFNFEIEASTRNLNIAPNLHSITGWLPFDKIEKIAQLEQIFHIRPAEKPMTQSGEVQTEGDVILRADLARTSFNVTGFGQKIGIISDGCDHLSISQASSDLPVSVQVVNNRFGGDEGTAMLEIAHDLAPGAQLAFADKGNSQADFANNIILLKDAGCTVICDDIVYPLEPVYEDGIIAQTIDDMVENYDMVYISSAGDQQLDHFEGDFIDSDNDNWHNFSSSDETMDIQLGAGAEIIAVLQWNNQFGKCGDDYDLFIYDEQLTNLLASSDDTQDGDDDPVEMVAYTNPQSYTVTVHLCIKKFKGQNRNMTIFTYGDGVIPQQYCGTGGAISGHAGAKQCLAVAAIDANDAGHDDIESFSSFGPTRIYRYDLQGNPTSFIERNKPDHAAIDGVQTKIGQLGYFSNPFYGTSAAAAHTAGIAALLRASDSNLTAKQVAEILNETAVDLGETGFDFIFGNGRLDAYQAVDYVMGGGPEIVITPDSFDVTLEQGHSKTEKITINNTGGTELNFSINWLPSSVLLTNNFSFDCQEASMNDHPKSMRQQKSGDLSSTQSNNKIFVNDSFSKSHLQPSLLNSSEILLYEGFEAGIMPPADWTKIDGPSSPGGELPAHWQVDSEGYIFSGSYSAVCYWGNNLDEWLITPPLDFSNISSPAISFWWLSSYYWHVSPNDNGDLFVKVSIDGGTSWQTLWTFGEIGYWEDFSWYYSIIDLSAYRGQSNVKIAFNVVASDNADIAIDEIMVSGDFVNTDWLEFDPSAGTIVPGSSQDVMLTFNTVVDGDTLETGNYAGDLIISSNDLNEPNMTIPIKLNIFSPVDIAGRISYYNDPTLAIADATIQLSGDSNMNSLSDGDGKYEFLNIPSGNYQVTPKKNDDTQSAITPLDVSYILQYSVGLLALTPYQKIAADVTGNGTVTAYDASFILRYTADLIEELPIGAEWTFVPHDYQINDSNWSVSPRSRSYHPLKTEQLNQDYYGILYGDVNGDWGSVGSVSANLMVEFHIEGFVNSKNGKIILPLEIKFSENVHSGKFKLLFNSNQLRFISSSATNDLNDDCLIAGGFSNDQLSIAFASAQPLSHNLKINLLFEIIDQSHPLKSNFQFTDVIIDDKPAVVTGIENKSNNEIPVNWNLSQNHPNPFNAETIIKYELPQPAFVTIEVINLLGQRVRKLVTGTRQAGFYNANWDGLDDAGIPVVSGIYLYKMTAGNFAAIKKMVVVR